MSNQLRDKTIVFLVAMEGIEQVELTRPWEAVEKAGGRPVLAATKSGKAQAFNHLDKADAFKVSITTDKLIGSDYGRKPDDLDAFCASLVDVFSKDLSTV